MDKRKFLDTIVCTYHHNIKNSLTKIVAISALIKKKAPLTEDLYLIDKYVNEVLDFLEKMEKERSFREDEYLPGRNILIFDE